MHIYMEIYYFRFIVTLSLSLSVIQKFFRKPEGSQRWHTRPHLGPLAHCNNFPITSSAATNGALLRDPHTIDISTHTLTHLPLSINILYFNSILGLFPRKTFAAGLSLTNFAKMVHTSHSCSKNLIYVYTLYYSVCLQTPL